MIPDSRSSQGGSSCRVRYCVPSPQCPIEETVRAIATLHADHQRNATPMERAFQRLTVVLARPKFLGYLTGGLLAWIVAPLAAPRLGSEPWAPPPLPRKASVT